MGSEKVVSLSLLSNSNDEEENENAHNLFSPFFCFYARELVGLSHGERNIKRDIALALFLFTPKNCCWLPSLRVGGKEGKKKRREKEN